MPEPAAPPARRGPYHDDGNHPPPLRRFLPQSGCYRQFASCAAPRRQVHARRSAHGSLLPRYPAGGVFPAASGPVPHQQTAPPDAHPVGPVGKASAVAPGRCSGSLLLTRPELARSGLPAAPPCFHQWRPERHPHRQDWYQTSHRYSDPISCAFLTLHGLSANTPS